MDIIIRQLLSRNSSWVRRQQDVGVTILVTPGIIGQDRVTVIAYLVPLQWEKIAGLRTLGERLVVSAVQQPSPRSVPRQAKSRSRLHYYLAGRADHAFDATPILVDGDGTLTETATANLLLVKDGILIGPPDEQILPGISLEIVLELASELNISYRPQPVTADMLRAVDEIILTGTGAGVWSGTIADQPSVVPVSESVRLRLQQAYDKRIGFDIGQQAALQM